LIFMGEEDFAPSDTRIEWADGGLARSQDDIEKAIDDLIGDYLSARGVTPNASPPTQSEADQASQMKASMEGSLDE
jgi:hypothetical protein